MAFKGGVRRKVAIFDKPKCTAYRCEMGRPASTRAKADILRDRKRSAEKGGDAVTKAADLFAIGIWQRLITQAGGCKTLEEHADELNKAVVVDDSGNQTIGVPTVRGKGVWTAKQVDRVLARFESDLPQIAGSRAKRLRARAADVVIYGANWSLKEWVIFEQMLIHHESPYKTTGAQTAAFIRAGFEIDAEENASAKLIDYCKRVVSGEISSKFDHADLKIIVAAIGSGLFPAKLDEICGEIMSMTGPRDWHVNFDEVTHEKRSAEARKRCEDRRKQFLQGPPTKWGRGPLLLKKIAGSSRLAKSGGGGTV
ncbi:hypothetical protein [Sphingobium yanoikuyae]|uniref:hypothetical protein n=1 Tax=Sphingobium yanoikuyae TaxID=13690 RepID=UPI0035C84BB1